MWHSSLIKETSCNQWRPLQETTAGENEKTDRFWSAQLHLTAPKAQGTSQKRGQKDWKNQMTRKAVIRLCPLETTGNLACDTLTICLPKQTLKKYNTNGHTSVGGDISWYPNHRWRTTGNCRLTTESGNLSQGWVSSGLWVCCLPVLLTLMADLLCH